MELYYKNNMLVGNSEHTWYENGEIHTKYENGDFIEVDRNGNLISDSPAN